MGTIRTQDLPHPRRWTEYEPWICRSSADGRNQNPGSAETPRMDTIRTQDLPQPLGWTESEPSIRCGLRGAQGSKPMLTVGIKAVLVCGEMIYVVYKPVQQMYNSVWKCRTKPNGEGPGGGGARWSHRRVRYRGAPAARNVRHRRTTVRRAAEPCKPMPPRKDGWLHRGTNAYAQFGSLGGTKRWSGKRALPRAQRCSPMHCARRMSRLSSSHRARRCICSWPISFAKRSTRVRGRRAVGFHPNTRS